MSMPVAIKCVLKKNVNNVKKVDDRELFFKKLKSGKLVRASLSTRYKLTRKKMKRTKRNISQKFLKRK